MPGHPPLHDMEPDLPALRAQWARRDEVKDAVVAPAVAADKGHGH